VATLRGEGNPGDEVAFVVLPDGATVSESGSSIDPSRLVDALGERIAPPFRALAVRRPELWAIGAVAIEVERLDPDPRGDELQLGWDGAQSELTIDAVPADPARAVALERIASRRVRGAYAAHAHRLHRDLWEISVLAL
jgi:hypothetical protein